ncbi:hypothetical protein POUND7_007832 [Theobroma cacao]
MNCKKRSRGSEKVVSDIVLESSLWFRDQKAKKASFKLTRKALGRKRPTRPSRLGPPIFYMKRLTRRYICPRRLRSAVVSPSDLFELVNFIYTTMSFVFRGTRSDLESGLPGFIPERRAVRVHAGRPVNSNSLVFLVTVLLLFMILNSHQMSPNFLLWLVLGVFLMATTLRMYATCQQLQTQAQAHAAAASGLLGHTELRLHMPPSIALATRGRLQGLRLQLALLDREFDDLDYETLRALDADNVPTATSMSEEEINALPVHKYKVSAPQSTILSDFYPDQLLLLYISDSSMQQASSSNSPQTGLFFPEKEESNLVTYSLWQKKHDTSNPVCGMKGSEDELTCSICLEQVSVGDLIRSLPCLHQFHASCIDPWLRQQGTCPVCKFRAGSGWHETGEIDASYMV